MPKQFKEFPLLPLFVSRRQAARLCGVCLRTLDQMIHDRILPVRRLRGRTLVCYQPLVDYASGKVEAGAEVRAEIAEEVGLRG